MTARRVALAAPAKVNLTLEILGRRADGYHDLASVMATFSLHDDVSVSVARGLDVRIRPDVGAPAGADLATLAARALAQATGRDPRARVEVRKRIPVAAGLGGGSSDAGAVLRALAALWRSSGVDLAVVGASVGSDVPFFAAGHAVARVGGRGERIEPLPVPSTATWIALVTLPVRLATASVFAALDPGVRGSSRMTDELAGAFRSGRVDPATLRAHARNDLLAAAERVCPRIAEVRAGAAARGIALTLSGSGPSLFAVADDRAHAIRMARALRRMGLRARPYPLFVMS
jgi:4-diphosphocytidyl-2-C-methyl-D-erythritol kinase